MHCHFAGEIMKTKRIILTGAVVAVILCLATLTSAGTKSYDCGPQALAYLLTSAGDKEAAQLVLENPAKDGLGNSISDLLSLAGEKLNLTARYLTLDDLAQIPLPAIIYFKGTVTGHFSVLTSVNNGYYTLYEPQTHKSTQFSSHDLGKRWHGIALFHKIGKHHGIALSTAEKNSFYGGDNETAPAIPGCQNCDSGPPDKCPEGTAGCCPSPGAPLWTVNPISMNLYVVDTPLYYSPPLGSRVAIRIEFNSLADGDGEEIFGKKWTFAYNSYLKVATNGDVTITMADGNDKLYRKNSQGGYTAPYKTFAELIKIADNHYELRFTSGRSHVYDAYFAGRQKTYLSQIKNSYNQALTIGYSDDRISSITDAAGKITTFVYNSDNLVTSVEDPFGRSAHFSYNDNRNLIRITDMGGYRTNLEYDSNNNLSAIENDGNRTEFYVEPADNQGPSQPYPPPGQHMRAGRRVTITHPGGGKEEFNYNGAGGYGWRVLPEDYIEYTPYHNNYSVDVAKTIYYYANTSKGVREEISSINYPNGEAKFFYYNNDTGLESNIADAMGNITSYTYNSKGKVTSTTNPKGLVTEYIYADNEVDLLEIRNGLGSIYMTYDEHHNILSHTGLDGKTVTMHYNDFGQLQSVTDQNNRETTYIYRADHTLQRIERNGLIVAEHSYDNIGRLASSKDATGLFLTYNYDNLNHLTSVTYPDGKKDEMEYSSAQCPRLRTKAVYRSGLTDKYKYTKEKKLGESLNSEGGVSSNNYDLNGNLITFTDPNNNTTSFSYDAKNRLLAKIYNDGKSVSYLRNSSGAIIQRTNARGIVTKYYYDENNNLITVEHNDGSTPNISIEYDIYDRITRIEDGSGAYLFTYDSASRIHTIDGPWANDTLTYSYDNLGRIATTQVEGGLLRSYTYDAMGRLKSVKSGADTFTYTFKGPANPLIATLTRAIGAVTAYQYNTLNQLTTILNKKSDDQLINSYNYEYNDQDQRSRETVNGALPLPSIPDAASNQTFNSVNQLLNSIDPDLVFTYDYDGNMTKGYTRDGYTFTALYDAENRLTDITYTDGGGVNRRTEYIYRWDSFLAIIRQYENDNLIEETRILRDSSLALQDRDQNNNIIRQYTWGANFGGGIGGLLSLSQNGASYSYLYDGKGNVVSVLDSLQNEVAQYRYNSFGKQVNTAGSFKQPFRFSTKRFDDKLGLVYYGYRFYNPAIERWINRDPLGEDGGINLYGFVQNDPVNGVDPWGEYGYYYFYRGLYISSALLQHYGLDGAPGNWFGLGGPALLWCVDNCGHAFMYYTEQSLYFLTKNIKCIVKAIGKEANRQWAPPALPPKQTPVITN